jgi:HAD superfamily hydrolase (TIGR01549 family)
VTRYTAVLFDLFDTLVLFDSARLPLVEINGQRVHTTARLLHERLSRDAPGVSLEACYGALRDSWREAERLRALDAREVPAPQRFRDFLRRLALDPAALSPALVTDLIDTHRRELGRAAEFPAHHGPLLRALSERSRLAIVSNFDYTPTALDILARAGVAGLFEAIVVSDEVGWRKPHPAIFAHALARLGVAPAQALFVGDRADIDVVGAQRAGMHAAWLNRDAQPLPAGIAPPEFEVHDLDELRAILDSR